MTEHVLIFKGFHCIFSQGSKSGRLNQCLLNRLPINMCLCTHAWFEFSWHLFPMTMDFAKGYLINGRCLFFSIFSPPFSMFLLTHHLVRLCTHEVTITFLINLFSCSFEFWLVPLMSSDQKLSWLMSNLQEKKTVLMIFMMIGNMNRICIWQVVQVLFCFSPFILLV